MEEISALIIVDKKIPGKAKEKLSKYGEIVELSTEGITYDAISGHPDIFFCKINNLLIVAPNLPKKYKNILHEKNISFLMGQKPVEAKYPGSALYNAAQSNDLLIHRLDITDHAILEAANNLNKINVSQGYCRCNILPLKENCYITSCQGIFKRLKKLNMGALYVNPHDIELQGFSHGFFGGACGVCNNNIFIIGSLSFFQDGQSIRDYLKSKKYNVIELYNGRLFDGGSILFID